MWRRRRSFAGEEWAQRDVQWVVAFLFALLLTARFPVFGWVLLGIALALVLRIAFHVVRRRRRERANADAPFWVDEMRR